jgi:hypothetical protein
MRGVAFFLAMQFFKLNDAQKAYNHGLFRASCISHRPAFHISAEFHTRPVFSAPNRETTSKRQNVRMALSQVWP